MINLLAVKGKKELSSKPPFTHVALWSCVTVRDARRLECDEGGRVKC